MPNDPTIAFPARDPGKLALELVSWFGQPTKALERREARFSHEAGVTWSAMFSVPLGSSRSPVHIHGFDDDGARYGRFVKPSEMYSGAWVCLTFAGADKAASIAAAERAAMELGGFITFDEKSWNTLSGECSIEGLDSGKYALLQTLGFNHALAVEEILRSPTNLSSVTSILQDEAAAPRSTPQNPAGPSGHRL